MFEKFKKKQNLKAFKKYLAKIKKESNSELITLTEFESILQCWKDKTIDNYDYYNPTLLANLLKEVYGNSLDSALINILDKLIADITNNVNGYNDDYNDNYDSYIFRIIRMLGVLDTPLAEEKLLTLLNGNYDKKVWKIVDESLPNVIKTLSSEAAIDAFIKFVKKDHPRNTYVKDEILIRLNQLQSQVTNPQIIEKLKNINQELVIRYEKQRKANEEIEKARLEAQRIAEFKRREEESQKWWDEHPDQERDPSRMDR